MTQITRQSQQSWGDCIRQGLGGKRRRIGVRLALLLAFGLVFYYAAYPHLRAYYHASRADRALANQDCGAARRHLEECLKVWSASGQRHFEAARCCWRESDPEEADRYLRLAGKLGWSGGAIHTERLFVEAQRELTRDLETRLTPLIAKAEIDQDAHFKALVVEAFLLAFLRAGRLEDAERAARTLVEWRPNSWRPLWLLGRVFEYTSSDSARDAYERSLALKADQPRVHFWLAKHHAALGRPNEALRHLHACHRESAGDAESRFVAARIHYLAGDWRKSLASLEPVLSDPNVAQGPPLALRGLLALEEKGLDDAITWLNQAEAQAPFHPDVIDAWTIVARRQGDKDRVGHCQQRKEQLLQRTRQVAELYKKLNALHHQAQARPEDRREIAFQLGSTLFQLGEDQTAEKWMKSVLQDEPEHIAAHQALAEYYERIGARDQAAIHRRGAPRP